MNTHLVDILMICYNHEKFIAEAIEGVLKQQTNFQYQLVIGEDFSTDNTRKICEKYVEKYSDKIKLLPSEKNWGIHHNFIRTFKETSAEYIALCEGDDYWTDPYKLQKQLDFLQTNPKYGMSYHNAYILEKEELKKFEKIKKNFDFDLSLCEVIQSWRIPTGSIIFRSAIIKKRDTKIWPNNLIIDRTIHLIIASESKIRYQNFTGSVYRLHPQGISGLNKKNIKARFNEIKIYYQLFKLKNLNKNELKTLNNTIFGEECSLFKFGNAFSIYKFYQIVRVITSPLKLKHKYTFLKYTIYVIFGLKGHKGLFYRRSR